MARRVVTLSKENLQKLLSQADESGSATFMLPGTGVTGQIQAFAKSAKSADPSVDFDEVFWKYVEAHGGKRPAASAGAVRTMTTQIQAALSA